MLTEAEATARLTFMVAASSEPTLSETDLAELLAETKRFNFWAASTAVVVGAVYQPTTANGHRYVCVRDGMTDTTQPTWPTRRDGRVSDGTAMWQEAGPQYAEQWDLQRAAHWGWMHKAAMIAGDYNFSVDGQSFSRDQAVEHCLAMAAQFAPVVIA